MNDDTVKLLALLVGIPFGGWLLNFLAALWKRQAEKARLQDESMTLQAVRRREDEKQAIDHLNQIIRFKDDEYEENRRLWYKEREQLLKERDRLAASYHQMSLQATMMQDRLAVYQGIGSEGAERMDPILVLDETATIRWANDPAGTFLGWPTLKLIGQPVTKIIAKDRHEFFANEFRQIIKRLTSLPDGYPLVHRYVGQAQRRDGSIIRVCVIINGFRLYEKVQWKLPDGSNVDQDVVIPVFRVHLRQRWEQADEAARNSPVPLNSSSGIDLIAPASIDPEADRAVG